MHLGYHELRNMLQKFKEDREKRRAAGNGSAGPNGGSATPASRPGDRGDYRSRDDYRDRDRGYERDRHSSRYEYVATLNYLDKKLTGLIFCLVTDVENGTVLEALGGGTKPCN